MHTSNVYFIIENMVLRTGSKINGFEIKKYFGVLEVWRTGMMVCRVPLGPNFYSN